MMGLLANVSLILSLGFLIIFNQTESTTVDEVESGLAERCIYIIHMDKSLMPKPFVSPTHWYASVLKSVRGEKYSKNEAEQETNILYAYEHALHGFSAMLSNDELEALKKSTAFISAYRDTSVTLDTTHTFKFLSLNNSTGLWPASEYGRDVIVGVIDTGVWPESPSFRDEGMTDIPSRWTGICEVGQEFNSSMCNKKLIGVRYFNKGVMASLEPGTSLSMNSGRDTRGHGTHTSSTACGNYVPGTSFFGYAEGTMRGIAPGARVAMYKVIWEEGRYASDVVAGIEQALADGVDVISISMGFDGPPLYEDPIAIASFAAMERGIVVSASAGNFGAVGSLHNGVPWLLTVAAGSVDRLFSGTLRLGNGVTIQGWSLFSAPALVRDLPLLYNTTFSFCNSTDALSAASDGIVMCDDVSDVLSQMSFISESGARAGIYISGNTALIQEEILMEGMRYPGVVVSPDDGQTVIEYAKRGARPSASILFQQTEVETRPAPVVALYTSRGPSLSCPGILKPDIMAPGTLVLASWNPNVARASIGRSIDLSSDFVLDSGTSMSCPHISGIAALLRGAHPEWSPAAVRSAIVTTANPLDNTGSRIRDASSGAYADPLAMGAGQVDPNRALHPGLVYDLSRQEYVSYLCSMNLTTMQIKTIVRSDYNCSIPSSDLNYPSFIALYPSNHQGKMLSKEFRRTVTYVGDGSSPAVFHAKVDAPINAHIQVWPPRLVFNKKYDTGSYNLTIYYKVPPNAHVVHGSVTWIDEGGKHTVRSPIVLSEMPPNLSI
ncbi:subtilase [Striga asiatica]|uniref:Subtilase n=1 Tax=Striga asiatica TaxID=4170 RepID=A0A5A7QE52_STRAF|nr:subtilase [Striga asiatica]